MSQKNGWTKPENCSGKVKLVLLVSEGKRPLQKLPHIVPQVTAVDGYLMYSGVIIPGKKILLVYAQCFHVIYCRKLFPEYLVFRWNISLYGVLIKGEAERMEEYRDRCVSQIEKICSAEEFSMEWYSF